ncbi:MAG: triose-phosphate isomerase [Mycoplasmoidaceae bacterium]
MKKLIIANWKLNFKKNDVTNYLKVFLNLIEKNKIDHNYGFAVPFLFLETVKAAFKEKENVLIASQNCFYKESGAYTGEISYSQLLDININSSLIGHSERREYFNETDDIINLKIIEMLKNKMVPILCVGESKIQRDKKNHFDIVKNQISAALNNVSENYVGKLIIAYEPIWAIGTGISATAADAEEMCGYIRKYLNKLYSETISKNIIILYGGSVNDENKNVYLNQPNINGALVGGASLVPEKFIKLLME